MELMWLDLLLNSYSAGYSKGRLDVGRHFWPPADDIRVITNYWAI